MTRPVLLAVLVARPAAAAAAAAVGLLFLAAAHGGNLLLNSSFRLASNRATPDYWDLHHAAAMEFKDLHSQYGFDHASGPIAGARVLRIVNSEDGFPYLYLLSRQSDARLPAGEYVFSVYARTDGPANVLVIAPSLDRMDLKTSLPITREWLRYSVEFRVEDPQQLRLSPLLALPSRGTYWISAPQLEPGRKPTPYAPAPNDPGLETDTAAREAAASNAVAAMADALAAPLEKGLAAKFEFAAYAGESSARLEVDAASNSGFEGAIDCADPSRSAGPLAHFDLAMLAGGRKVLNVPIAGIDGRYACAVHGSGQAATAGLVRMSAAPTVRVDQFQNRLLTDGSGFQIRGIMIGSYVPPDWYVADIVDHGINTLIFSPGVDAHGGLATRDLDAVLKRAEAHGVKVIVGPAVMGRRTDAWPSMLQRYAGLVARYRARSAIIGWFVVDEPQARTLRPGELLDIYGAIKSIDPGRLVFVNWGSDDVPTTVGAEPHGTLAASDLYSIDYYPFANDDTSLESFALRTVRAFRTARLAGLPGHSWLQLYGYLDVSREPTGGELNFMAYVDFLLGGNYSFWQIKSNAKPTWDRVRETNREIRALGERLTLDANAVQIKPPALDGRYLYSIWRTARGERLLIVIHVANRSERLALDLGPLLGAKTLSVRTYFGDTPVEVAGSTLEDSLGAYATRVYRIE